MADGQVPADVGRDIDSMAALDTQNTAHPTLPTPQTGALTAPPDINDANQGAEDALSGGPNDMAKSIARHTMLANQVNQGGAKQWAENAVAGVNAALAGFGAGGKVPPGGGWLYGAGAAARQAQEARAKNQQQRLDNNFRERQLNLEQQKVSNSQTNELNEYDLKLAENARQQAASVRDAQMHDQRMQAMNDEHDLRNFQLMRDDIDFRDSQIEKEENIKAAGGKLLRIGGADAPAFDHLGQLEDYAMQNDLGTNAHNNGYRTRPLYGADHKWHLYEVPDNPPEWHNVKGPDGKTQRVFTDTVGLLNYQDKVAQVRHLDAETTKSYADAKKAADQFKQEGTVKAARANLSKVDGDYSKLSAGDKEALTTDAQKRFQLNSNVLLAAQRDMERDPDFSSLPVNQQTGDVDPNTEEYKDLASKYHVDDAQEQVWDAYDELRQLGHGYKQPGGGTAPPAKVGGNNAAGNQAPAAVKVGDTINQGGKNFKVTAVDKDGKPTAAEPAQ